MESAAETKIAHAVYYFCSSLFEVIVFRFSSLHLRGNPAEPACLSHPQSLMTAAEDEKKKRLPNSALKRSLIPFLPFFRQSVLPSLHFPPSLSLPPCPSKSLWWRFRPTYAFLLSLSSLSSFFALASATISGGFLEGEKRRKEEEAMGHG